MANCFAKLLEMLKIRNIYKYLYLRYLHLDS